MEGFIEFRTLPDYVPLLKEKLATHSFPNGYAYIITNKTVTIKTCEIVLRPGGVPRHIDPQHFLDKLVIKNKLPGVAYCPKEFPHDYVDFSGRQASSRRFSFIPDNEMLYALIGLQKAGQPLLYAATYGDITIKRRERPSDLPSHV